MFEPTKDDKGRTIWLATFHRWWWSKDALLVCATTESDARRAVERERPDLAARLHRLQPASPALAHQVDHRPPLSRRMTVVTGD